MKKYLILVFTCFLLFGSNVNAHSILKSTNPQDGEIIKEELTEIILYFQAEIEEGSKLMLVDEAGENVPVNVTVKEKEMVATPSQQLENGSYSVIWEAASTDGHLLDGKFSFVVELEQKAKPQDESTDNSEDQNSNVQEDTLENKETQNNNLSQDNEKNTASNSYLIYGIVGLLVVALIISIRLIKK